MEQKDEISMTVLMLPWLAHGHIGPFLELAKKLTERNIYIYFCSTPVNLDSITDKIPSKYSHSIKLVEIQLPSSLPDLPPHYHTTKGLPTHLIPTLRHLFEMSSPSISKILETLNPDVLISDFIIPWAQSLTHSLNIAAVEFVTTSATMTSLIMHVLNDPSAKYPFPAINIDANWLVKYRPVEPDTEIWIDLVKNRPSKITLIKTFREIEGKYVDHLSSVIDKRVVPVGPLVQDLINEEEKNEIIEWLNRKERSSAVFVSFGTEYFLSMEEIKEIAYGLELTNLSFIWVIRSHMGERINIEEALPEGFLDRAGERGMVVEGWAPQGRILGHGSIGGFVSHCGWGSVMESMKYGVPIIAMPMDHDQPINTKLVEEVGVGVEVKRDVNWKIQREEVAKVIKEVVVERSGESVRHKAKELSEHIGNRGDEEIDRVVDVLRQLCMKTN